MTTPKIPNLDYGILQRDQFDCEIQETIEEIRRLGYGVIDSGLSTEEIEEVQNDFDHTAGHYFELHDFERLRRLDEHNTIRAPLVYGDLSFIKISTNSNLLAVISQLIVGKFILNQQNGIINPPNSTYNQAAWHRDLPYQHYVSSSPLAINALFCVDDFNKKNGSTFVLPASHKTLNFPSANYVKRNAVQVEARAGQYIILDCMVYHSGGHNSTSIARRAVNHVYTIPYFKQQIKLPGSINSMDLSSSELELLGFDYQEPTSVEEYLMKKDR